MKCESCQQREATIVFTTVTGDQKQTLNLCPQCSQRESEQLTEATPSSPQKVQATPVAEVKKVNVVIGHLSEDSKDTECPECGLTYDEFRKIGRLGCTACYQSFGDPLRRLLKRIHGTVTHVGRGPRSEENLAGSEKAGSLVDLHAELERAVEEEAYERAAELRDRIARQQGEE